MNKAVVIIMGILIAPTTLHAVCTQLSGAPSGVSADAIHNLNLSTDLGCSPTITYYKGGSGMYYRLMTCSSCGSSTTLTTESQFLSAGHECGDLTYKYCKCNSGCNETDWASLSTGYEKRTVCNGCTAVTQYRCAAGYYGTTTDGSSGCTHCPWSPPGSDSPTSEPGSTEKTSCYITKFGDSSGNGVFTKNCHYSL